MESPKNIRILLILPFFYPHRGGSQKYAEELYVKIATTHPNVWVDILCYNTDNKQAYEEFRNLHIYRIPCLTLIPARFVLPNPFSLLTTLKSLAKNHYDFVNTHIRFFDPTWWVWLYSKIIKAQSIFTGHVVGHPVYQSKLVELVAKIIDLTVAKFSLKFYDHITFTNKAAQIFFNQKLGVKKESNLVYGGVDTTYFKPGAKLGNVRCLPKLGTSIARDNIIVTYVGRLIKTKGLDYLYATITTLYASNKANNVVFVLAGPGEMEEELAKSITKNNLENKVFLTGNLNYAEVQNLLAMSDIFVNPSVHNEGFPNTILEAGVSECFVIATDNAGTKEVIEPNVTGILIPQKDTKSLIKALEWAFDNTDQRLTIAKNLKSKIEAEFDWTKIAESYYQLLVKWLNNKF